MLKCQSGTQNSPTCCYASYLLLTPPLQTKRLLNIPLLRDIRKLLSLIYLCSNSPDIYKQTFTLYFLFLFSIDRSETQGKLKRRRDSSASGSVQLTLDRKCIFHLSNSPHKLCGTTGLKFYKCKSTGNRKQERLSQCLTLAAEKKLKDAAAAKQDDNLLMYIYDRDLIAIEVCYHRSCYGAYTSMHGEHTFTDKP